MVFATISALIDGGGCRAGDLSESGDDMLIHSDRRGLAISPASIETANRYEEAITSVHSSRGDAIEKIERLIEHDSGFVGGHCLRAAAMILGAEVPGETDLLATVRTIEQFGRNASDRERRHATAARAWLEGNSLLAAERYGEIVVDYPRDSIALQVAHALDFRLGQREMLRDRVAQVLPHWDTGVPVYGYVLGMYAFGLEETGDYARARNMAFRSLALEPFNAAAMHVVAHVMEMQGRTRDGIEWLRANRGIWAENKGFAIHIAWHLALFHIDTGELGQALAIYDRSIAPAAQCSINSLVDASALLWRLDIGGIDAGERWEHLADCWQGRTLAGRRAFTLVHAVMAFAATHRVALAKEVTSLLREDMATQLANVSDDLKLAVPLAEALQAFSAGDYSRAVDFINTVRAIANRCGGSVAQCDVIHLTLVEAAIRGHRESLARALTAERSARKPESPFNRWLLARVTGHSAQPRSEKTADMLLQPNKSNALAFGPAVSPLRFGANP